MKTTFIYALKDPTTGLVRYIGKADRPDRRLSVHLASKEKGHRTNWIKSLVDRGLRPELEIVDEVPFEEWPMWEIAYIENFRELGYPLTNLTVGGEGSLCPSPETRKKLTEKLLGRIPTSCHREKTSKSVKQSWDRLSPEEKALRVKAQKDAGFTLAGVPQTEKQKESLRIFNTGKKTKNSPSKYIGVFRNNQSPTKKWRALIYQHNKQTHLGSFETEIEAARAYDAAAKIRFGDKAKLNFPDENQNPQT